MGKPSPHIPCRNHYFNISLISIVHKNISNTCMISRTFVNVLFSLFLCCYQMFATSRLTHTQERGRFQTSHKTPNGCPINMEWTCKLVLLLPMLRESYTPWILILERRIAWNKTPVATAEYLEMNYVVDYFNPYKAG